MPSGSQSATTDFDLVALKQRASVIGESIDLHVTVKTLDDFATTQLAKNIRRGDVVVIHHKRDHQRAYKRVLQTHWVLEVHGRFEQPSSQGISELFLLFFYSSIAVAVFFWIWPLSRDLRSIARSTGSLGDDGLPEPVKLGPRSAIYFLATAYNQMADRIRQLVASHEEMTYAVSHELRTPLARMKFALEMAQSQLGSALDFDREMRDEVRSVSKIPDKQFPQAFIPVLKHLTSIKNDVGEMDLLVNELLNYASFERSGATLDKYSDDLVELTRHCLDGLPNAALSTELVAPETLLVACDWYLMERVLINLVNNAARYGQSILRVTLETKGAWHSIVVEDDGPGIPLSERQRVFDAFVRLRSSQPENTSGFGLGLAIVKRIAKWHKGRVVVEHSKTLGGARFVFIWPASL